MDEDRNRHYVWHSQTIPMEDCLDEECQRASKNPKARINDDEIDTRNDFLVGVGSGGWLGPTIPVGRMDKAKALRLAAWLVVLADPLEEEFPKVLEAIKNT
jgi:hypothetical protein